jgi:non-specific serine/threonine protein kinase
METSSERPSPYVFLSYASTDRERALRIADRLEANGIAVWIDRKSIAGGMSWSAEIVRGIKGCAAFLVACSSHAMASPNVQQEVQLAWETRRTMVPLLLQRVELPDAIRYALAGRQWIEVLDRTEEDWLAQLRVTLRGLGVTGSPRAPTAAKAGAAPSLPAPVAPRHNLPAPLTSFVGRQREIAEVEGLLETARLVTVAGPGGCGKTRLSLEVASRLLDKFAHGVWFVELAPLADPGLVVQTIATVLDVREVTGRPLLTTLADQLRARQILLLLDNCEHLIAACAQVAEALLRSCPGLHLLATSREPLGAPGEVVWRVPSLALPASRQLPALDIFTQIEGIQLFVERSRAVVPSFAVTSENALAMAQVCRRLDGVPLAIELAAARVRVLTVEQIAARLDDRFRLLTGGSRTALRRQQTLQATIDWSYELLSEEEQTLLRRTAVFAGSWTLEAAEAICAGGTIAAVEILDQLTSLVDKSLVLAEGLEGQERYRLLETIRQYARDRLATVEEAAAIQNRHAAYYLALAEQAETGLQGAKLSSWLIRLTTEWDNLRAALRWSAESEDAERALHTSGALRWFWYYYGYPAEACAWLADLLSLPTAQRPSAGRARALLAAAMVAWNQSQPDQAYGFYAEALELARTLDDRETTSESEAGLGIAAVLRGDYSVGRGLLEQWLANAENTRRPRLMAYARLFLGQALYYQKDHALAWDSAEQSRALFGEMENQQGLAAVFMWEGHIATADGNYALASTRYRESLTLRRQVAYHLGVAFTLGGFANLAAAQGQHERAACLLGAAASICDANGTPIARVLGAGICERLAASQDALDPATYDTWYATGQAMPLEQAIAYALSDDKSEG